VFEITQGKKRKGKRPQLSCESEGGGKGRKKNGQGGVGKRGPKFAGEVKKRGRGGGETCGWRKEKEKKAWGCLLGGGGFGDKLTRERRLNPKREGARGKSEARLESICEKKIE